MVEDKNPITLYNAKQREATDLYNENIVLERQIREKSIVDRELNIKSLIKHILKKYGKEDLLFLIDKEIKINENTKKINDFYKFQNDYNNYISINKKIHSQLP